MFEFINKAWNKMKIVFNNAMIVSFLVIVAFIVTNPVLTFFDDKYGLNTITWFLCSHLFKIMPFIYDEYKKFTTNCPKLTVSEKLWMSFKKALVRVGTIDVFLFILAFIPIINDIVGLVSYIPIIGQPMLFVASYLFIIINQYLNPFYYLQEEFVTWVLNTILGLHLGDKCANPYFFLSSIGLTSSGFIYFANETMDLFD